MDRPGIPLWLFFLVFAAIPGGFAILFGWLTWARMAPLAFRCRRCNAEFRQSARRPYPVHCPACGSGEWNLPG